MAGEAPAGCAGAGFGIGSGTKNGNGGGDAPVSDRSREVAERANVSEGFVRRLVAVGALPAEEQGLGPREVRRARLLYSWEAAGLSVERIVELVDRGALSLMFLDAPVMATPERLDRSYRELAADLVERAPATDLPPAHVGIHTGPVVFQDGDVYGRTVNLAARIAGYARAGQVVVGEDTARRSGGDELRLEPLGPVELKGVARPLPLYQARRTR